MRRGQEFSGAVRRGARGSSARLVVHLATDGSVDEAATHVGLIVPRSVGNAVHRNRVKRRLRALMAGRVQRFGRGTAVVVRALPASADASSDELAADLDSAIARAQRKQDGPRRHTSGRRTSAG